MANTPRTTTSETRVTRETKAGNVDIEREEKYWREAHQSQPYYSKEYTFEEYAPAYRVGYESYGRYGDRGWDESEGELRTAYEKAKGKSKLGWERAKDATRAAWERMKNAAEELIPGDSDHDGH